MPPAAEHFFLEPLDVGDGVDREFLSQAASRGQRQHLAEGDFSFADVALPDGPRDAEDSRGPFFVDEPRRDRRRLGRFRLRRGDALDGLPRIDAAPPPVGPPREAMLPRQHFPPLEMGGLQRLRLHAQHFGRLLGRHPARRRQGGFLERFGLHRPHALDGAARIDFAHSLVGKLHEAAVHAEHFAVFETGRRQLFRLHAQHRGRLAVRDPAGRREGQFVGGEGHGGGNKCRMSNVEGKSNVECRMSKQIQMSNVEKRSVLVI